MNRESVLFSCLVSVETQSQIRKLICDNANIKVELSKLSNEIKRIEDKDIEAITIFDTNYPELLKQIADYPPVIFCRGNVELLANLPKIAIVGSRKSTKYGEAISKKLATTLSLRGATVVSGLAFGIDSMAHLGSYNNPGRTIAVLGTPIDEIYPKSNSSLANKILKNDGLIISENPPGSKVDKYCFPLRNRIIAGLSEATVVVEAAEKSGSLITANLAAEYNRYIYAVPGNIDRLNSRGTNDLISNGATCLSRFGIILEDLGIGSVNSSNVELSDKELLVSDCINKEIYNVDRISEITKIEMSELNSIITEMELKGIVNRTGGTVIFD